MHLRITSVIRLGCLLGLLAGGIQAAHSQSKFERVLNTIVSEIERQANQDNQPQPVPEPVPGPGPQFDGGIWGNRFSNFTGDQKGNFRLRNQSNNIVRLGFTRPNNGGTYAKDVVPNHTYTRRGLPIGSTIFVDGGNGSQTFNLAGSLLEVTVSPNGQMTTAGTSLPPENNPRGPDQVGALYITNRSGTKRNLQIDSPRGMGAWVDEVKPFDQWARLDLMVGTNVVIDGRPSRTIVIKPGTQRAFIQPSGRITTEQNDFRPFDPITPPARSGMVVMANQSNSMVTASIFKPRVVYGYQRELSPGTELPERNLPQGTQIIFNGPQTQHSLTTTGLPLLRVEILPDGRVSSSDSRLPPSPGPTPSVRGTIEVMNRSGKTITASYGTRVREIRNNRGQMFATNPPGQVVQISGNGATATFQPDRRRMTVWVFADGRFDKLPAGAIVMPDAPVEVVNGHLLVVNRSPSKATVSYQVPTTRQQSFAVAANQTMAWRPSPAGTSITVACSGNSRSFTILPNQWTSFLVDSSGKIETKTTLTQHDLTPGEQSPTPLNPDPPAPSNDDPPAPELVSNPLPKVDATPLVDWLVTKFSRNTTKESLELVDLLDASSKLRLESIVSDLQAAGAETDGLLEAATSGDANKIASLSAGAGSRDQMSDLAAIATLREQLIPLRSKIASGASSASVMPHVSAIANQATNLGNAGLAAAMKRLKRDFAIHNTISRGLEATGLQPHQVALPKGKVNVISHPWVNPGNTYFASTGLVLKDSQDDLITVAEMPSSQALNLPVAATQQPLAEYKLPTVAKTVTVANPSSNGATLRYRLNDEEYALDAGQQQSYPAGPQYVIDFTRGSSGEKSRFDISSPGVFVFKPGEGGWALVRKQVTVKVANPPNSVTLAYSLDGKPEVLEPGSTAVHKSNTPIMIAFDQGEGFGAKKKVVEQNGAVYFAIDEKTGYWDLYEGEASQPGDSTAEVLRIKRPTLADIKNSAGTSLFDFSLSNPSTGNLIQDLQ